MTETDKQVTLAKNKETDLRGFDLHFHHGDLTGPPHLQVALNAKVTFGDRQSSEESTNMYYVSRLNEKPIIFAQKNIC